MKYFLIIILLFVCGCENIFYDNYKIIDINKNQGYKKSQTQSYTVKSGDNLFSISRKFRIQIQELINFNQISEPYRIFPGQKILIPITMVHSIKKGETLYSISRDHGTNVFTLSKLNNIYNVNNIFVGQKLIIPRATSNKKSKTNNKKNKINKIKKLTSENKFLWPVKGKVISKFGKTNDGFYNDGINIYSEKGTNVISSEDGKVIYSGNEIPGYGNLVLIKHSKNWITAYAHLDDVFIEKGNSVRKGQNIGSVGSTGNVRSPQLHFEIRKGKDSVDPLKFLWNKTI